MHFFDLPNKPLQRKIRERTVTQALEREEIPFVEFTDKELYAAKGGILVFDIEVYPNYFLAAFKCYNTNKVVYFEKTPYETFNIQKLLFVLHSFTIVGFNSNNFDIPLIWLAMQPQTTTETLKNVTNFLIKENWRPQDVEKAYNFRMGEINHIDLIEVAPLQASLKTYGGRLHAPRMQDLPFDPEKPLSEEEMRQVRSYCINDLELTALLLKELSPQLELRAELSQQYKQDLRSKSDAQIAEAVLTTSIKEINGYWSKKPKIEPGTSYKYSIPDFIQFKRPQLQKMLELVRNANFVVAENGSIQMPPELDGFKVHLGNCIYRMGIGGLHSSEECVSYVADENTLLIDRDVSSYYPNIILNQGLYPKHLGENFLYVYRTIVERRLKAKKEKNKVVADALKITINGSFGKLGSKYSALYSPDLLIQVTLSGQLCLLMLIEMIVLAGTSVVSGNTDGIIIKCSTKDYDKLNKVIKLWEDITKFETEETRYKAVYSANVNNYIAIKEDNSFKAKGYYAEAGLSKNPISLVCIDATTELIINNIPIEQTIINCKDITKFVTVRNVKGGAEKDGIYLGKVVRYYYAKGINGTINYVINGNKVPNSDGAKPCMDLPHQFPEDINYDRYIEETISILKDINYIKTEKQQKFF